MQLRKVTLHNIRSYTHEEVSFPKGSVLLSGDIGSGKSSLLLGIEFAIFGILRGTLDGSALLRHGTNEGYVELACTINDKDIVIHRTLKRTNRGATQDHGWITIDGIKQLGTAQELKSKMLDIMGYPSDLLTKNKSLIFRYTVYTPQEQMKHILFEDADERLNTLRKVFDIDRYKRMKENANVYVRFLRGKKQRLEGELQGYDQKVQQYDLIKNQNKEVQEKLAKLEPDLLAIKQIVNTKQQELQVIETKVTHLFELKKRAQVLDTTIKYELQRKMDQEQELKRLEEQHNIFLEEFKNQEVPDHNTIVQSIKDTEARIEQLNKQRELASRQISEFGVRISHSTEIKTKLHTLDACPTCLQEVSQQHKDTVVGAEDNKIKDYIKEQAILQTTTKELESKIGELNKDLNHLRIKERDAAVYTIKQQAIKEKEQQVQQVKDKLPIIKTKLEEARQHRTEINHQSFEIENVEHLYKEAKANLKEIQKREQLLEVKLATTKKEQENVNNVMKTIAHEIAQKQDAKKRLTQLTALSHWIGDFYIKLMDLIEKHVLSQVYHQFNGLFQKWFTTLIEDETMQARLDDAFTPIVTQNGYETDLNYLSGGEKTSCALAYRLALNRVINDIITNIHTKDLIILDEPTDGFSMEQLDRVRAVLDELDIDQVILVSHEAKIESFVDNVINVHKENHESVVNV